MERFRAGLPSRVRARTPRAVRAWWASRRDARRPARRSVGNAVEVRRLPSRARTVLLTFDAGADAGSTSEILELLAAEGIPAGFGLTRRWAEEYPDLVRRIAADGHTIINHSDDHPSFTGYSTGEAPLDTAERVAQLERTDAVLRDLTGTGTRPWFRPPFGDLDASVLDDVGRAGWNRAVLWTLDSLGWKGLSASEITARCLDAAEPGAIYLFHVGSQSADGAALPAIVAGLRAAGYRFDAVVAVDPDRPHPQRNR